MQMPRVLICLPAFNEEKAIPDLLRTIKMYIDEERLSAKVIVVDDGSTDDTVAVCEQAGKEMDVEVLRHGTNKGLGDAILTGLRRAMEISNERDVIVTMDADNSHTPGLILRMVRMIREGNDVVVASRYAPGANIRGVTLVRRILSYAASVYCRALFPTRNLKDYTSGYRAYKIEILKSAFAKYGESFIVQSGFACMIEILLRLRAIDAIFAEAPLILRYDKKESASKMHVIRTIGQTLLLLAKVRFGGN